MWPIWLEGSNHRGLHWGGARMVGARSQWTNSANSSNGPTLDEPSHDPTVNVVAGNPFRRGCSAWRQPAKRTVRQLPQQPAGQLDAERRDRVRIMPLGADAASRAGGSPVPAGGQRIQDDRRGRRGKNGSARPSGTHKLQCIAWHDGGTRASCDLRSAPVLTLVSVPPSPVR